MTRRVLPWLRLLVWGVVCFLSFEMTAQVLTQVVAQVPLRQQEAKYQSLKKALNQLERRFKVTFAFDERVIQPLEVSTDLAGENLDEILADLLPSLNLTYKKVRDKLYVIQDKSTEERSRQPVLNQSNPLQLPGVATFTINGRVTNNNQEGLPGVSVLLKGTTNGTATDTEGRYSLSLPDNQTSGTLVFSFIGYTTEEVAIGNRTTIDIALLPDVKSLSEVVVVGYNTQQKRDITGAVSTVKAADLQAVPATNFAQQLQGRAAGVTVSNDAAPGGGVAVRIRGIGSVTGSNDPLYVIDGVPTQGNINQLNPNDIESLQVLKDASTASIYGARASNGVIIITTKKGKSGEAKVSFDAYVGSQQPNKLPDLVTPQQFADISWQNFRNTGQIDPITGNPVSSLYGNGADPLLPDYVIPNGAMEGDPRVNPQNYSIDYNDPAYGISKFPITRTNKAGTDWFKQITRSAPIQSYNLTLSGGSSKGRYAVSGGYFDQQGILKFTGFKRYSLRANTEFTVKNNIRLGENLQVAYTDDVLSGTRFEQSPITLAYLANRLSSVYDINGYYAGERGNGIINNPYAILERNKDNHNYNGRVFGNVYAETDIWKVLTFRTSFGLDYNAFTGSNFSPAAFESLQRAQVASLTESSSSTLNYTWTNILTYKASFGDKHQIVALAGTEAVKNRFRFFNTTKSGFAFDDLNYRYLNAGAKVTGANGSGADSRLFSLFAKIDYAFADKYLLSATVRRDASSRFAASRRFGTFPAFSAGWRLSEENFMKGIRFLDDLKLRASWGQTGNQEIDNYNQYTTYGTSLVSSSYDINGTSNSVVNGFEALRIGNPNAQWEAQTMTNLGLDASLFNGKLDVSVDAYNRQSSKLLLVVPGPATDGQNARPAINVGGMRNRGLDVVLNYHGSGLGNELKFDVGLNWSTYRNKVTELYAGENAFIAGYDTRLSSFSRTQVGQPIASFYGYVLDGIFQTQEEANAYPTQGGNRVLLNQPGRFKFRNVNGDTVVSANDQTFIGNPNPKFSYGLNLSASYKGIDLTVFLQGVYGNHLFNYQRYYTDFWTFLNSPSTRMLDSWTPENRDAVLPQINSNASSWESQSSSYYLEKGSYLRAKNVQLGYSLPKSLLNKTGIDRLRLYMQANNLFTITDYSGLDPEVNLSYYGSGADRDIGVDRGIYPVSRTYLIGLQLGF